MTHSPGPDWTCTCGYDYFGGSAAYSWQLYEEHVKSAMPDPASLTPEESDRWAEALDGRPRRPIPPEGGDRGEE